MTQPLILLCYKNWLETRTRFILSAMLLFAVIWYAVHGAGYAIRQFAFVRPDEFFPFTKYIWFFLYKGYLLTCFIFASFIFGLGGIMSEKQSGAVLFTMSLPLKRNVLMRAKIIVASMQVFILAMISLILILLMARIYNFSYPFSDALKFSLLMTAGGWIFMMLGVSLSLFVAKELVIPTLGIGIIAASFFLTKLPSLSWLNIFNFMCGSGYLSNQTFLFTKELNWTGLLVVAGILILATITTEWIVRKKDF